MKPRHSYRMMEDEYYTSICSAATLQSNKKGFFQSYADTVIAQAGTHFLYEFKKLKSDAERLLKIYNNKELYEVVHGVLDNVTQLYRGKAEHLAVQRRGEGEREAKKGRHERALLLLTQAVIRAPPPGSGSSSNGGLSLPMALWSRAFILRELSEHHLCLADVQLALKEKLPDNLRTEAYWLMAECYRELEEPMRAKVALQVALKTLPPEDNSWRNKIEEALKSLSNDKPQLTSPADDVTLLEGPHPHLKGLSSALSLCSDEQAGRYIVARQPIRSGDVLAVEPAHIACLLPDKFGSHCHHCFARLRSAVACRHCAGLAFCSVACRDAAQVYHQHECRYMDLMIGSGMSILCYIALRTITQQKYKYWQKVRNKQPVNPDYNNLANLVTHADKRKADDFVSRTLMALFLLKILEHSGYIPSEDCDDDKLSGMRLFLGSVLLHLLQCLQFNAHEIYETMYKSELDFTSSKINYIAVGVYPSVALLNHDCYPAIARYFRGKEIVVRAVRPLKPGDIVAENYGPVFTFRTQAERHRSLLSRYWFKCECKACRENWPKLEEMDENSFQLRCQKNGCEGFVTAFTDGKKQKAKCNKCSTVLNTSELALLVKSYNEDYSRGFSLMSEGKLCEAAEIFSAFLDVMHVICKPPMKNISLAQEAMRSCFAYPHNKHVVK
ncbi:SET and MYND domain-containing protein 4 isoform X2 [Macrosteles quadrilineatus]|uniref:SET and MYND domain-containing protein 4 isoform X2 n=1 Tax=Macrosteles quadrilineatus TaxID=74068 RepID=UPI0023E2D14A|nr:SET and MYND domain-containing protein 4 isoform X2 [Macrosteles quadrilineatus]